MRGPSLFCQAGPGVEIAAVDVDAPRSGHRISAQGLASVEGLGEKEGLPGVCAWLPLLSFPSPVPELRVPCCSTDLPHVAWHLGFLGGRSTVSIPVCGRTGNGGRQRRQRMVLIALLPQGESWSPEPSGQRCALHSGCLPLGQVPWLSQ